MSQGILIFVTGQILVRSETLKNTATWCINHILIKVSSAFTDRRGDEAIELQPGDRSCRDSVAPQLLP